MNLLFYMKKKVTNVTKILDHYHINYELVEYTKNNRLSGKEIAALLNQDINHVFKTLITVSSKNKNNHYCYCIPVNKELDLKKCAAYEQEKAIEMIKEKELLPLTGYVHGGCSFIGLKNNKIKIRVHKTFFEYPYIYMSAGEVGYQVKVNPNDLKNIIVLETSDFIKK